MQNANLGGMGLDTVRLKQSFGSVEIALATERHLASLGYRASRIGRCSKTVTLYVMEDVSSLFLMHGWRVADRQKDTRKVGVVA